MNLFVSPGKHLFRGETSQRAVMMPVVVPIKVFLTPCLGALLAIELSRVVRLILHCLELRFADCIVVADTRSRVTFGNAQFFK